MGKMELSVLETGAVPGVKRLQTAAFQRALDEAWLAGGGVVSVPAGRYWIGGIRLRSNTTLHLLWGAELYGSRNPEDYDILKEDTLEPLSDAYKTDRLFQSAEIGGTGDFTFMLPGSRWNNAIIRAVDAVNVAVIGEIGSILDGQNCFDELGEEHYRGPHGIGFDNCRNVLLSGVLMQNTGNWAVRMTGCKNIVCESLTALAGHDGVHFTRCENITVRGCRFLTGDDCIAGFANTNVTVSSCEINTACSAFRFGGTNVLVRDCHIWGPAEYLFRGGLTDEEKRSGAIPKITEPYQMLSVFTYYGDYSSDIPEQPGNIVIRDCVIENVTRFLQYNYSGNERWQSNRPLESLTFEHIKASGISLPLTAYGSPDLPLSLTLRDVEVSFAPEARKQAFVHAANFDTVRLERVRTDTAAGYPLVKRWTQSGEVILRDVTCKTSPEKQVVYTEEPFFCKPI